MWSALKRILPFTSKTQTESIPWWKKRRKKHETIQVHLPHRERIGLIWMVVLICILGVCFFCLIDAPWLPPALIPGQIAPENIYAQTDFYYIDQEATRQAQQHALQNLRPVFQLRPKARSEIRTLLPMLGRLLDQFGKIDAPEWNQWKSIYEMLERFPPSAREELRRLFHNRRELILQLLNREEWLPPLEGGNTLIISEEAHRQYLQNKSSIMLYQPPDTWQEYPLSQVYTPISFSKMVINQIVEVLPWGLSREAVAVLQSILYSGIQPDAEYNESLTAVFRRQLLQSVQPIRVLVHRDQQLLARGQRVTEHDIHVLQAHVEAIAQQALDFYYLEIGRKMVACFWLVIGWMIALYYLFPSNMQKKRVIFFLGLIIALNLLGIWGSSRLWIYWLGYPPHFLYSVFPYLFAPTLITTLLNPGIAILSSLLLTFLTMVITKLDFYVLLSMMIVSSLVCIVVTRGVRNLLQLFRLLLYVPPFLFIINAIHLYLLDIQQWSLIGLSLLVVLSATFLWIVMVILLLPIIEWSLGLISNIRLFEYSDLNHPLLRALSEEASGTYTHTMSVATLAEQAAIAIQANPLLARVMSYFHDIGKLSNPLYFTENSRGEDMHKDLSPKLSARIILHHVQDGEALAKEYKLPESVREGIISHHGTSLILYFYQKAKEMNLLESSGGELEFRYPGPKPHSPEATILALADACEAASRSLVKITPEKIENLVDDIFYGKLTDGQFDESSLTMKDLLKVKEAIQETLKIILHGRVAYPKRDTEKYLTPITGGFSSRIKKIEQAKTTKTINKPLTAILPSPSSEADQQMVKSNQENFRSSEAKDHLEP